METCPTCGGRKTINVRAIEMTKHGNKQLPLVVIDCVSCKGKGEVTKEYIEAMNSFWCNCGAKSGSTYYPDGSHPGCLKHHYRCNECGKVTQTG